MRACLIVLLLTGLAGAHDFWLKPGGQWAVLWYGHEEESAAYAPEKVKKALGLNSAGQPVAVKQTPEGDKVRLSPSGEAAQLAVEVDTGYWSKTPLGWQNKPRREAGQVIMTEWSLYYSKLLFKPQACVNRAFGQKLEIVPIHVAGPAVKVKVLLDGKPQAGLKLYANHERVGQTSEAGEAMLDWRGLTVVAVSCKQPLEGNPDADRLNLNAVLTLP